MITIINGRRSVLAAGLLAGALAGCATTVPANSMSTTRHETVAAQEDREAAAHARQYDPGATKTECLAPGGRRSQIVCWTSSTNPTAEHLREARRHHERAAAHRAASQELRDAEARACVGIPEDDRDMSPFAHREDIDGVDPLYTLLGSRSGGSRAVGAAVRFRAVPGMTPEWLQRLVDCHLARSAAMGYDMPEMNYCPLMLKGVTATVISTGRGFAIEVRSDSVEIATEIRRRAEALVAPASHSSSEPVEGETLAARLAWPPPHSLFLFYSAPDTAAARA